MRPLRPQHIDGQESHDISLTSASAMQASRDTIRALTRAFKYRPWRSVLRSGVTTLDCDEVQPQYIRRQALLQTLLTLDFETG